MIASASDFRYALTGEAPLQIVESGHDRSSPRKRPTGA
jgi:hypothetical protein